MAEPNKPKQAIEPKISEDHEEVIANVLQRNLDPSNHFFQKVLLLKGVMEKGCTELGNILCSLESNETLVKQKNYLKVMQTNSSIGPPIYSLFSLCFASTSERKYSVHWDPSIEFQSECKGSTQYN